MSKVGAAGIWQIMPATGRRYLRVSDDVDERLNIRASTMAAAQILRENYEMLGTWPLAITAYNHGANGIKQAVATVGTTDFGAIVQRYRGPLFGFASQNFYAEFLAAVDLAQHYKQYFGDILFEEPSRPVTTEARATSDPALLVASTPQFDNAPRPVAPPSMAYSSPPVVSTPLPAPPPPSPVERPVMVQTSPLGVPAVVPGAPSPAEPRTLVQASPPAILPPAPMRPSVPEKEYRVRPGDSLFAIAQRHGTTVETLTAMNGLRRHADIRAGQMLRLPAPPQSVVSAEKAPQKGPVVPVMATVKMGSALPIQRTVLSTVTRVPASTSAPLSGSSAQGIRLPELDERFQIKGDTMRVAAQE